MSTERVRFAPSPTGYLHIGGARTALFNWLFARKTGGKFILRIEDTDQERSTAESCKIILEGMRWLGMTWDEGPEVGGDFGPYSQMERLARYKQYAEMLISSGHAYRCCCTKEELDAQRVELEKRNPKAKFRYPGTCRNRNVSENTPHVVRFKVPTEGVIQYTDLVFGFIETPNLAQQDFILLRQDGIPLYNFGAVVDDVEMQITLVARGRDHMVNTPPQIMIYEALGARIPRFAHLPMILDPGGKKLSKRAPAHVNDKPIPVAVADYEVQGYNPTALLNYLVRFGWSHGNDEVFSQQEMVEYFGWEACNPADGKFDEKKLLAINFEHLKQERLTTSSTYVEQVKQAFSKREPLSLPLDSQKLSSALPLIRERARTFAEAADMLDYFFRDPPKMDAKAVAKFFIPANAEMLKALAQAIASVDDWTTAAIDAAIHALLVEKNWLLKDVAQPARVALTGRTASPGLHDVIAVLGKELSCKRLLEASKVASDSTT